jgi:hypothetical protein
MKNEALLKPVGARLNAFTSALAIRANRAPPEARTLVKLRDESWREVQWVDRAQKAEVELDLDFTDRDGYFVSYGARHCLIWNADGSSLTSRDFDLIEMHDHG